MVTRRDPNRLTAFGDRALQTGVQNFGTREQRRYDLRAAFAGLAPDGYDIRAGYSAG